MQLSEWPEGEKDVDTLSKLDLPAFTFGGVGDGLPDGIYEYLTGHGAVTINSVTERLKAPKGSFYYRFASRDALLGELWLTTVLAYQEGFVVAIEARDGLGAALHTPAWARRHLDDARLLLLQPV